MLPTWERDGGDGYKGPCPLCAGEGRRAWARPYSGRWRAGCPVCGARGRRLIRAIFDGAAPAVPNRAASRPADALDVAAVWRAAHPADDATSAGRLAWWYVHGRTGGRWSGPLPPAVRWLPVRRFPPELDAWLRPWRRLDPLIAAERPAALPPAPTWRAPDGAAYERSTRRLDGDVDGLVLWRWTPLDGTGGPALEVEALAAGRRRELHRPDGSTVKRAALPGTRFGGRVFVARPRSPGGDVHMCEGAPDALAVLAYDLAPAAAGVIGAHGARALVDVAGRLELDGGRVHLWAHGDADGERAADRAAAALDRRGVDVVIHFGCGDVLDADAARFEELPAPAAPTWEGDTP